MALGSRSSSRSLSVARTGARSSDLRYKLRNRSRIDVPVDWPSRLSSYSRAGRVSKSGTTVRGVPGRQEGLVNGSQGDKQRAPAGSVSRCSTNAWCLCGPGCACLGTRSRLLIYAQTGRRTERARIERLQSTVPGRRRRLISRPATKAAMTIDGSRV